MGKSGNFFLLLPNIPLITTNLDLVGEYNCNLDAKGRFLMPAKLLKQLPEDAQANFVLNRGFEKCLLLYPKSVWAKQVKKVKAKNSFTKKNREFVRRFSKWASKIVLDNSARILIPKSLMEFAGLTKEIVLIGALDKVEIWDKEEYEAWYNEDDFDYEELAEEVMGDEEEDEDDQEKDD